MTDVPKPVKGAFDWMSNPQYLAQVGHFLGGVSLITISMLFAVVRGAGWTPTLVTFILGVAAASFKEFVFDVSSWGEGDSWSDSLMDWSFYMLGGGVGMGIAAIARAVATG
jgi:hypothetical protein